MSEVVPWLMAEAAKGNMFGQQPERPYRMDVDLGQFGMRPELAMLVNPFISGKLKEFGINPTQFFPTQNVFDQIRAKHYWQQRQVAMADAATIDAQNYMSTAKGIAAAFGSPLTPDQQEIGGRMATTIAGIAPMLGPMVLGNDAFDMLHGPRGSAGLMAMSMHRGGRYAIDPITGMPGLSGKSASALTTEMNRQFFSEEADLDAFRGFSGHKVGQLYEEMQARGLMPAGIGRLTGDDKRRAIEQGLLQDTSIMSSALTGIKARSASQFEDLAKKFGLDPKIASETDLLTAGQSDPVAMLKSLESMAPLEFENIARRVDVSKVGQRLKEMSTAVSAMRDIMGESGNPNAPMPALLAGLDKLGSTTAMSTQQLTKHVRLMNELSVGSGMGLERTMAFTDSMGDRAQQMGLGRDIGKIATPRAISGADQYRSSGDIASPGYGVLSQSEMLQMQGEYALRGAGSQNAAEAATIVRLAESLGDLANPQLKAAAAAVKDPNSGGMYTGPDGKQRSVFSQRGGSLMDRAKDFGVSGDTLARMMHQSAANEAAVFNNPDIVNSVMQQQSQEFRTQFSQVGANAVQAEFQRQFGKEGAAMAQRAGDNTMEMLLKASADVRHSDGKLRTDAVAEELRKASGGKLDQKTSLIMAQSMIGEMESLSMKSREDGGMGASFKSLNDMYHVDNMKQAHDQQQMRAANAAVAAHMDTFGRTDAGKRMISAYQGLGQGMSGKEAWRKLFNQVDPDKVQSALLDSVVATRELGPSGLHAAQAMATMEMTDAVLMESTLLGHTPEQRLANKKLAEQVLEGIQTGGAKASDARAAIAMAFGGGDPEGAPFDPSNIPEFFRKAYSSLGAMGDADIGLLAKNKQKEKELPELDRKRFDEKSIEAALKQRSHAQRTGGAGDHGIWLASAFSAVDKLSGDSKAIGDLGAGGLQLVQDAQKARAKLNARARELGVEPGKAIASGDKDATDAANELWASMSSLDFRKKDGKLSADEQKKLDAYDKSLKDDAFGKKDNEELIAKFVSEFGIRGSGEAKDKASAVLGLGTAGAVNREMAKRHLDEYAKITRGVKAAGFKDVADVLDKIDKDAPEVAGYDETARKKIKGVADIAKFGRSDVGGADATAENLESLLTKIVQGGAAKKESEKMPDVAAAKPAGPTKLLVENATITIKGPGNQVAQGDLNILGTVAGLA